MEPENSPTLEWAQFPRDAECEDFWMAMTGARRAEIAFYACEFTDPANAERFARLYTIFLRLACWAYWRENPPSDD